MALCLVCGLVQQSELPSDEELRIYYSHNYRRDYKKTYHPKLKYVRRAGITAVNRISFLKAHAKFHDGMKLIDIGAGGGEFVYIARRSGLDASGIEPNEGYSEFAVREYGVDIQTAGIDRIEEESADIISLFHVFEHLAHPLDAMEKIANGLKNEGLLFIEVPNILQKDASPHNIYFKAHLFYYSRFTLMSAASRWFEPLFIEDSGNLTALLRKRSTPLTEVILPSRENLASTVEGLKNKGWGQYLFQGGGLIKPLSKLKRAIEESAIGNKSPRQILDELSERVA